MAKATPSNAASQPAKATPAASATLPVVPRTPPLFRRVDWITLGITFAVVWTTYFLTLAPQVTLEDSGELCTGAFYAGIPHPPGYPFWAIYSWLWTVLLPVGNVAWRVEVGQATAAALACGLVGFMVSRGSSMLMEGIEELKQLKGVWENAICLVSGAVAGLLLGFGGVMWSESVAINRISLFGVPWMMVVLLCLLRWIYAPHQRRYLFCAMYFFGICATIHQTLLVAAMAIEVTVAATQPKLGRDLFLGNSIIYVLGLIGKSTHFIALLDTSPMVLGIYHTVGLCSIAAWIWLSLKHGGVPTEWATVLFMGILWILGASFYFYEAISGMTNPPMQWGYPRTVEGFFHALSRGQYEKANPTDIIRDPGRFMMQLSMLVGGVVDEYSWILLFVALLPFLFFLKMQKRERAWILGLGSTYICIGVLLIILMNPSPERASADLIKVFFTTSHAVVAILIGYGLALVAAYMATHYKLFHRWGLIGGGVAAILGLYTLWATTDQHFFGLAGGLGLGELPKWIAHAFAKDVFGLPVYGALILMAVPFVFLAALLGYRQRAPLAITLALYAALPIYSALCHYGSSEQRNHWWGYWFGHDMFLSPYKGADGKPLYPDMTPNTILYGGTDPGRFCPTYMIFCESFLPPKDRSDQNFDRRDVYLITQNALADGTYLCYLRAQYNRSKQIDPPFFSELVRTVLKDKDYQTNLLARMMMPLDRFFMALGARVEKDRRTFTSWFTEKDFTDLPALVAKLRPGEKQDPVSRWLFNNCTKATQDLITGSGEDSRLRKALVADWNVLLQRELLAREELREKLREKEAVDEEISNRGSSERRAREQEALTKTLAELAKVEPLYTTNRFRDVKLTPYLLQFIAQNPESDTRIRLNRLLLEAAYPGLIAKSLGGVYPDREIYIPTPEDSQKCFQEYLKDAERRVAHDQQFPNEPRQIKPGEDVRIVPDADGRQRVQVAGQVAVMSINGLLTKVIFDNNPDNDFYVEESFPLDWMFPYMTPYSVIMKINRQPVPEYTEDIVRRDHEFWSQYAERCIGTNVVTYDTPISNIVAFIEKLYLRKDFSGFKGDRKFIRDDQAQKAFSKLRSSIGGLYTWRINDVGNKLMNTQGKSPEEVQRLQAEYQRVLKEADFAFRQAYTFCPYSPEAVFRYAQLLVNQGRVDDALLICETCRKLDPYNPQVLGLIDNLKQIRKHGAMARTMPVGGGLQQMEETLRTNPNDFQNLFSLSSAYMGAGQTGRAMALLEQVAANPQANVQALLTVGRAYAQLGDVAKVETTATRVLQMGSNDLGVILNVAQDYAQVGNLAKVESLLTRATQVAPDQPEVWYDLAAVKATLTKQPEAAANLRRALELNAKRVSSDPKARNLTNQIKTDYRFNALRSIPEFKPLFGS